MKALFVVGNFLLVVIMVFVGPLFSMMALNALFGTSIAYTLGNWFAMVWVHLVLGAASYTKAK